MSQSDRFTISEGAAVLIAAFLTLGAVAVMFFALRPDTTQDVAAMGALEEERDRLQGDLAQLALRVADMEAAVSMARDEAEADRKRLEEEKIGRLDERAQLELKIEELTIERSRWTGEQDTLRRELNAALQDRRALEDRVKVLSDAAQAAAQGRSNEPVMVEDELPPGRMTTDVALRVLHDVRVVEVNRPLAYVVLDVGESHGVKAGMMFNVMDGNRVIAKAKTIDVRPEMSGASVDQIVERFPSPNDRAILRREPK